MKFQRKSTRWEAGTRRGTPRSSSGTRLRSSKLLGQDGHWCRRRPRCQLRVSALLVPPGEGGPGRRRVGELTSAEREKLKQLRQEVREQQQTGEILKDTTAFFVKENDRWVSCTGRSMRRRRSTRSFCCAGMLKAARSSCYAWREGEAARRARQAADDTPPPEPLVRTWRRACGRGRHHARVRQASARRGSYAVFLRRPDMKERKSPTKALRS